MPHASAVSERSPRRLRHLRHAARTGQARWRVPDRSAPRAAAGGRAGERRAPAGDGRPARTAERVSGTRMLRTTGRVAPNENPTYPIVAGVSGWIREVGSVTTGRREGRTRCSRRSTRPSSPRRSSRTTRASRRSIAPPVRRSRRTTITRIVRGRPAVRRHATEHGRLQLAARGDGQPPRARAGHPRRCRRSTASCCSAASRPASGSIAASSSTGSRICSRVWILADVYEHQLPFIRRGAGRA